MDRCGVLVAEEAEKREGQHPQQAPQYADRIARIVRICRHSLQAVLPRGIDRQWTVTDRVSTVKDLLGLQVFYSLPGPRGRCGRYVNDPYGYIDLVQVNEGCCLVISRR